VGKAETCLKEPQLGSYHQILQPSSYLQDPTPADYHHILIIIILPPRSYHHDPITINQPPGPYNQEPTIRALSPGPSHQ